MGYTNTVPTGLLARTHSFRKTVGDNDVVLELVNDSVPLRGRPCVHQLGLAQLGLVLALLLVVFSVRGVNKEMHETQPFPQWHTPKKRAFHYLLNLLTPPLQRPFD